ncbi:hypothetical protein AaE_011276 [Aphanomyces astaci]|nr:hypothetical protein AaE_011276 [Aphanomyces astaci]
MFPPHAKQVVSPAMAAPTSKKRKDGDKDLVEIERARLEIKRRKEARLEREAQVNYRILVAKAEEAELALKVARAKARQVLLNSGISIEEVEHVLL